MEQQIAAALKGYGFSDESTAAVLGNLKAESAMDPASDGFKFQERQLLRERNRVYHYLNKAVKRLEAAGL